MVMESVRKKFIQDPLLKEKIATYIENFLSRAWVANVDIQHSPIATKIYLEVANPKAVIERRRLVDLSDKLKMDLNVSNPQISVIEVKDPWLEPKIVAKRAALDIMRGGKVRPILFRLARSVMESNAVGIEIIADGKLGAKGARSKKLKVYVGFVPKAGDPANQVKYAHQSAITKHGIVGITVRIATEEIYERIMNKKQKKERAAEKQEVKVAPESHEKREENVKANR